MTGRAISSKLSPKEFYEIDPISKIPCGILLNYTLNEEQLRSVADPGFPVGRGADPLGGGGAPTSNAYTFR